MRCCSVLLVLPAFLAACGDKSAVSLSVDIPEASINVTDTPFPGFVSVSGAFDLHFALGPESSGSTTVTAGSFSLQSESGAPLVEVLSVVVDTNPPWLIAKGTSKDVHFTFSADSVLRADACPGPLRIVGSVMDSLKGATDPVQSAPLTPNCGPAT